MRFDLNRYWYRPSLHALTGALLPFSWLFGSAAALRRWLYRREILKTERMDVPVIVVGNITAGGTGKTPFVIWLAEFLRARGWQPGIVSRGVGSVKRAHPHVVRADDVAEKVGDEAVLLMKKSGCPVVIGVDRALAVKTLLANTTCDVVISDDGLQHYRLGRDIEIALVDGVRRLGNQRLMPAGPLREPVTRLQRVDMVIVNGGHATDVHTVAFAPTKCVAVCDDTLQKNIQAFSGQTVHAVAAIGHPERFFLMLKQAGVKVIPHVFPDHYFFQPPDIQFGDALPVLMTEKDAVKCREFADACCWFVEIEAQVGDGLESALEELVKEIN